MGKEGHGQREKLSNEQYVGRKKVEGRRERWAAEGRERDK